jgi:hypothetical protein
VNVARYLPVLVPVLLLPLQVFAAIDTTDAEAALADITTVVTTIGGVMLGAAAVAVAFKWAKASIFG